MIHLTARNFLIEAKRCRGPAVVMFYAVWCGKCAMMKPVAEHMERRYYDRIKFCEVEIEESAVLAAEYGVNVVPTFVCFKDGEVFSIMQGVIQEDVFEERIKELL